MWSLLVSELLLFRIAVTSETPTAYELYGSHLYYLSSRKYGVLRNLRVLVLKTYNIPNTQL